MEHDNFTIEIDDRPYSIWGKYKLTNKPECIDCADNKESADYLLGEYMAAFGKDWQLWIESD